MKVLIVDDNPASAQTLCWMLELFDHQGIQAHAGEEALRLAEKEKPDMVLMDIGLPDIDGYEACKRMRDMPELQKTLFVAQTGWSSDHHREKSKEAGFAYHLVKPVELETLRGLLNIYSKEPAVA